MADSSTRHSERRSEANQTAKSDEPLFEGETLRISPQYLRRFLSWLAERRG
jgi:hypothetical protein